MLDQRNRTILAQSGLFGSFDAPWSEWSWINLLGKKPLKTVLGFKNPILDFPKETQPYIMLRGEMHVVSDTEGRINYRLRWIVRLTIKSFKKTSANFNFKFWWFWSISLHICSGTCETFDVLAKSGVGWIITCRLKIAFSSEFSGS